MMKSSSARGASSAKVRYSAVKTEDSKCKDAATEKSPLLENMEHLSISSPVRNKTPENTNELTDLERCDDKNKSDQGGADDNASADDTLSAESKCEHADNGNINETSNDSSADVLDQHGAESECPPSSTSSLETSGGSTQEGADNNLDIVRKMSQPLSKNYVPWRKIGPYQTLRQKKCQRLYAATGRNDDLALFYHNGMYYVMEAWCTHMGGPLFEGDIEDYNGKCHVMCPWHSYMFDLQTGMNEIGLRQKVYDLKLEGGQIFVRYHTEVTIEPNRKPSVATGPRVINRPPEGKHEKMRKQSVLDTPLKL